MLTAASLYSIHTQLFQWGGLDLVGVRFTLVLSAWILHFVLFISLQFTRKSKEVLTQFYDFQLGSWMGHQGGGGGGARRGAVK